VFYFYNILFLHERDAVLKAVVVRAARCYCQMSMMHDDIIKNHMISIVYNSNI